jgi:hypothetical protein
MFPKNFMVLDGIERETSIYLLRSPHSVIGNCNSLSPRKVPQRLARENRTSHHSSLKTVVSGRCVRI